MSTKLLTAAKEVMSRISSAGYEAYIVGGAVRDMLLNNDPKDVDIATNMPISKLGKAWKIHDIGKSKDFGIVVVAHGGHHFEVAQFRCDGAYEDGRRPSSVAIVSSFREDAARRDFTINAMGMDSAGAIVDFFGGQDDLRAGIIRAVGKPHERFEEDFLRIMRAVRFASRFQFSLETETEAAIKSLSSCLTSLASERIKEELFKAASMGGSRFAQYVGMLDRTGILPVILPEVSVLKGYSHNPKHHPESDDVLGHTIEAIRCSNSTNPIVNLALLFHDAGKSVALGYKNGEPTYYDHDNAGESIFLSVASRLKFSNEEKSAITFAIVNHMRFHGLLAMKPSKVAKMAISPYWGILVQVAKADEDSRGEAMTSAHDSFDERVSAATRILETWGSKVVANGHVSAISGDRVMALTSLPPGKEVGRIMKVATSWAVDNDVTDPLKIEEYVKGILVS